MPKVTGLVLDRPRDPPDPPPKPSAACAMLLSTCRELRTECQASSAAADRPVQRAMLAFSFLSKTELCLHQAIPESPTRRRRLALLKARYAWASFFLQLPSPRSSLVRSFWRRLGGAQLGCLRSSGPIFGFAEVQCRLRRRPKTALTMEALLAAHWSSPPHIQ